MSVIQDIAKELLYSLDYERAVEIEEDDDWVGSVHYRKVISAFERIYAVGFNDGMEQISRTF